MFFCTLPLLEGAITKAIFESKIGFHNFLF